METIISQDLNLDAAALEQFASYLSANKEAVVKSAVPFMSHNSNNTVA
jgi:hypothetical protein